MDLEDISTNLTSVNVSNEDLDMSRAKLLIGKLQRSRMSLRKSVYRLKDRNKKLTKRIRYLETVNNVTKIWNRDQMKALHVKKSARNHKWCSETIRKALRLRLSAGVAGYQELLDQGIPLPTIRTLRRRCEHLKCEPGICEEIFDTLREQVSQFRDDRERDCMLALDEMSIMEGTQPDQSTMSHFGLSTLPNKHGKVMQNIKTYNLISCFFFCMV